MEARFNQHDGSQVTGQTGATKVGSSTIQPIVAIPVAILFADTLSGGERVK